MLRFLSKAGWSDCQGASVYILWWVSESPLGERDRKWPSAFNRMVALVRYAADKILLRLSAEADIHGFH